jgi:hypothetical protein
MRCPFGGAAHEFAGHSEVDPEPCLRTEAEGHLFAMGQNVLEGLSNKLLQLGWIHFSEEAGIGMAFDLGNGLSETGSPLVGIEIDLCEFGHFRMTKGLG